MISFPARHRGEFGVLWVSGLGLGFRGAGHCLGYGKEDIWISILATQGLKQGGVFPGTRIWPKKKPTLSLDSAP